MSRKGQRIAQPSSALAGHMHARGYLLVGEAAKEAHVRPATIYRWLDAGHVEGCNEGGARFVSRVSLLRRLGQPAPIPQAPYRITVGNSRGST